MIEQTPPRIRVAAVIEQENRLLLVQHTKAGRTYFLFPGGGVQRGETLEQALIRELREETGYSIAVQAPVLVHDSIAPKQERHIVNIYFRAMITGSEVCGAKDPRVTGTVFKTIEQIAHMDLRPDIREHLDSLRTAYPVRYPGNIWKTYP